MNKLKLYTINLLLVYLIFISLIISGIVYLLSPRTELTFPKSKESKYCTEEYIKQQQKLFQEIDSLREIRERTYYLIIVNPTK